MKKRKIKKRRGGGGGGGQDTKRGRNTREDKGRTDSGRPDDSYGAARGRLHYLALGKRNRIAQKVIDQGSSLSIGPSSQGWQEKVNSEKIELQFVMATESSFVVN